MAQEYIRRGETIASEPYHYTQCGLDDVYLLNGFKREPTPYGDAVSVENADELQHVIAEHLCMNKAFLSGKEFRFLRKLMDLTQGEVAIYLGCDVQSVARWEKGKTDINGAADKLLRLLYLGSQEIKIGADELIKKLAEIDSKMGDEQYFEDDPQHGWKAAA